MSAFNEIWSFEMREIGGTKYAVLKRGDNNYVRDSDDNVIKIWSRSFGSKIIEKLADLNFLSLGEQDVLLMQLMKLDVPEMHENDDVFDEEE